MNFSIETTNYVNNALLALSSNPLLYDHSYAVVINSRRNLSEPTKEYWLKNRIDSTI